ncbi:MAG TPA: hypothetical protein VFA34_14765 [Actinomycetota bacterium]|jgi:hypothetical protein|nr:hypothetical protein [Actinomycetota bacterium]
MLRVIASAFVATALLAGCTIETSDLEVTEEEYLQQIERAVKPLKDTTEAFDRIFQKTTRRATFLDGIEKIPYRSRIIRVFREIQEVTPPPRFFRDQRRLLRALVSMAPVARAAEELAGGEEIIKASARYAHAYVLYERALVLHSSRFCLVAATSAAERDLCDPVGILPGAGYGDRLHEILARASAEFTPRAFFFLAKIFDNEEVARYLRSVGPAQVDGLAMARNEISKLVPPDEFAADHRVLREYFINVTRVSHQIVDSANNNPRRLFTLFPETQRLVERAGGQLSESIRPAVAVWFFPSK